MLETLPLWMLVAIRHLKRKAAAGKVQPVDYARRQAFLTELRGSIPTPANKLEAWLVKATLEWIDREQAALLQMRQAMVVATGVVYAADEQPPHYRILV